MSKALIGFEKIPAREIWPPVEIPVPAPLPPQMTEEELWRRFRASPLFFIQQMWRLVPQEKGQPFLPGKHLSWQQVEILRSIENAIAGKGKRFISISSGHGIGKSSTFAMLIVWFLFCHKYAQIACTAPTAQQMHDVLAKEVSKWIRKLPPFISSHFECTQGYIRMKEAPDVWFCRFATAKKEAPEALAGVHGDHVMLLADEASAIPEEIFEVAQGALTNKNILFLVASNPTRLSGFFFESQHRDKHLWETFTFSSRESPIVEQTYVKRMEDKYGSDSSTVQIRVDGKFPVSEEDQFIGYDLFKLAAERTFPRNLSAPRILGVDVARYGDDATVLVERQGNLGGMVRERHGQDTMATCGDVVTALKRAKDTDYNPYNFVCVDVIGLGSGVFDRLIELQRNGEIDRTVRIVAVNVAEKAMNESEYTNKRAELWGLYRDWIKTGAITKDFEEQTCSIKYLAPDSRGRLRMEAKEDMKERGLQSPDRADAFCLTLAVQTARREFLEDQQRVKRALPRWAKYAGVH